MNCQTCKFWSCYGSQREFSIHSSNDCLRHAPTRDLQFPGQYNEAGKWPKTYGRNWCGDWEEFINESH